MILRRAILRYHVVILKPPVAKATGGFSVFIIFGLGFGFSGGKRVFADRFFHLSVADMGIDLRGVELFVTEDVF